jgi:hypothetical protein
MPASWRRADDVPRYFLHLRFREGPYGLAVDEEGDEVPDPRLLREHVEATAWDLNAARPTCRHLGLAGLRMRRDSLC